MLFSLQTENTELFQLRCILHNKLFTINLSFCIFLVGHRLVDTYLIFIRCGNTVLVHFADMFPQDVLMEIKYPDVVTKPAWSVYCQLLFAKGSFFNGRYHCCEDASV